jgi:hypothetical protein
MLMLYAIASSVLLLLFLKATSTLSYTIQCPQHC